MTAIVLLLLLLSVKQRGSEDVAAGSVTAYQYSRCAVNRAVVVERELIVSIQERKSANRVTFWKKKNTCNCLKCSTDGQREHLTVRSPVHTKPINLHHLGGRGSRRQRNCSKNKKSPHKYCTLYESYERTWWANCWTVDNWLYRPNDCNDCCNTWLRKKKKKCRSCGMRGSLLLLWYVWEPSNQPSSTYISSNKRDILFLK